MVFKNIKINRRDIITILVLGVLAAGIRVMAAFPAIVELVYSTGVYPYISAFLRKLSGVLPFSMGDLLYALLILYVLWRTVKKLRQAIRRPRGERQWRLSNRLWIRVVNGVLLVYIAFNGLWGLNYNRLGIHYQLDFERGRYSKEDLVLLNELLLEQVNQCKESVIRGGNGYGSTKEIRMQTKKIFHEVAGKYAFLQYKNASVKSSLFNVLGNYLGYSGYYNPFTGEAQVNTDLPLFLQPFVACHEVAHQLGYAKENEANFAGYITATASGDPLFSYAAYFDLFLYANRVLYRVDSTAAKDLKALLHPEVQKDIAELKAYYRKYESPLGGVFDWVYGKYLKANQQPKGLVTYSEVVADVIGWYKRYGKISG